MMGLEFDQVLDQITPLRLVWAGLGIVTVCLVLMLLTRWGDSKPVAKCLVLSLLAHCVLALYGTTVLVAMGARRDEERRIFQLEHVEAAEPGARTLAPDAPPARLLDAFVHRADIESSPLDLPRPEAQNDQPPTREPTETPMLAEPVPRIEVPLESPETPRPGQATRSEASAERVVVTSTSAPEVAAPQSRSSAETPLPGPRQTEVRPSDDLAQPERRQREDADVPAIDEGAIQVPRSEPSPVIVPHAKSVDDRDTPSHLDAPTELFSEPEKKRAGESGESDEKAARPAFVASPSLRQRPDLGQQAEQEIERSRPTSGAVALPSEDHPASVPSGELRDSPALSALTPRTPHPTDDSLRFRKRLKQAAVYRFRMAPNRSELAVERGGSRASERAVEDGLAWLAAHQSPDGRWDADGFAQQCPIGDRCDGAAGQEEMADGQNRDSVGGRADTGVTGLALLAFLGAGYTHQGDRYAENIGRALQWLVAEQDKNGSLAGDAAAYAHLYCHGMATIALCEAYGMTGDSALRAPAQAAIDYIVAAQHPTRGGWRYGPRQLGDTSSSGWQVMALKSAVLAGIDVPAETYTLAHRFLDSVAAGRFGGLASYRPDEAVKASMTAEALFTRQLLGLDRENAANNEAGDYLLERLPDFRQYNLYYWYYGTLTMYQLGGKYWKAWNEALRDTLIQHQRKGGHLEGSWDPLRPWGGHGGRVYSTALSVLCLEIYYRFLPLYSTSGQLDEAGAGRGVN